MSETAATWYTFFLLKDSWTGICLKFSFPTLLPIFDLLVVETNRYATTVCEMSSYAHTWSEVMVQEMKTFLRVLLSMSSSTLVGALQDYQISNGYP